MTGTATTEAEEFMEIYKLGVVEIPTNRPIARLDEDDKVYRTTQEKYDAIVATIKEANAKGQPILVGTTSIEKSELLSQQLTNAGIIHNVLNARQHEQEAQIVADAGKLCAVTIATNMAGLPGGSFQAPLIDGLPTGYQLTGRAFGESMILNAAHQVQMATDWHTLRPEGI